MGDSFRSNDCDVPVGSGFSRAVSGQSQSSLKSRSRSFSRKTSSSSSILDALDYFADICEEIDDIYVSMTTPSPQDPPPQKFFPPNPLQDQQQDISSQKQPQKLEVNIPIKKSLSSESNDVGPIRFKLFYCGNSIESIVPANQSDLEKLLKLRNGANDVVVSVDKIDISLSPVLPEEPDKCDSKKLLSSSVGDDESKLISPKHIYCTSCDTYRVQISKGSKVNPNGKFSRNARSELDAFWLCECALILVDRPSCFHDMLFNGNYKCLLQRGYVVCPDDYKCQLRRYLGELYTRKLVKKCEYEKIAAVLQKHAPLQNFASVRRSPSPVEEPHWDEPNKDFNKRDLCGWGSLLASSWSNLADDDRKKRRRLPMPSSSPSSQSQNRQFFPLETPQHINGGGRTSPISTAQSPQNFF